MTRFFWIDGRLSWPLVIGIAYLALSLIVVDFFWRILVMPFTQFLAFAIVLHIGGAALIAFLAFKRRGRG